MFNRNLVVVINNSDADALRVSLPPLRRFRRKFTLFIHNNNNCDSKITPRIIKNLGWGGKLHVINAGEKLGEFDAFIATIDFLRNSKMNTKWIMFIKDTDVLIDAEIPNVSDNIFAVVQNATTLCDSHVDLFKINPCWTHGTDCGKTGPHFEMNGTMILAKILFEFVDFIRPVLSQTKKIMREEKCDWSMAMWEMLNTMMRALHPEMSPIYMNQTNYVVINLGHTNERGKSKNQTAAAMARFHELAEMVATQNMVAENQ